MGFLNWARKLPDVFWPLITRRFVVLMLVLVPTLYISYRIGKHSTFLNLAWGDIVHWSGADQKNGHWLRRVYAIIWYVGNWFTSLPYIHHRMQYFDQFHGLDWAMRKFTIAGGFILTWPTHVSWRYIVPIAAHEYLNHLRWPDLIKVEDFIPFIFDVWHVMGKYLDEAKALNHISLVCFLGGDAMFMGVFLFAMLGFLPILAYHRFWCILFADRYEHLFILKPFSIIWLIFAAGILWAAYRVFFVNNWRRDYELRSFFPKTFREDTDPLPEETVQSRLGVVFFWIMISGYISWYYLFWHADLAGFTYYMYDFGSTASFWDQWKFKYLTGFEHLNYIRFMPFISIFFSLGFFAYYTDERYTGWHMEKAAKLAVILGFMLLSISHIALFLFFFQCLMYMAMNTLIDAVRPENCNQPEIELNLDVSRRVLLRSWGMSVILTVFFLMYFYAFTKTFNFDEAWIKYNLHGLYVQKFGCMLLGAFTGAPYMLRWGNNANIYMAITKPIPRHEDDTYIYRRPWVVHPPTTLLYYGVISIAGFWLTAYCFWQWTWATGQYKLIFCIFVLQFIIFYVLPKEIRTVRLDKRDFEFMDYHHRWFVVHTFLIWKFGFEQFIFAIFIITNWYQIFGIVRYWGWVGMSKGCYRFFQPVGMITIRRRYHHPDPAPWAAQWLKIPAAARMKEISDREILRREQAIKRQAKKEAFKKAYRKILYGSKAK